MENLKAPEVSDEFWAKVGSLFPTPNRPTDKVYRRAPGGGRKPVDARKTLSAILYVLRNDISWHRLRQGASRGALGDLSGSIPTLHRHFKSWQKAGVFAELRRAGLGDSPELKGLAWDRLEGAPRPSPAKAGDPALPAAPIGPVVREREPSLSDPRIRTQLLRLHSVTEASTFWTALQALFRESIPNNSMIAYLDYFDHPRSWMAAKILATENANMPAEWFEERWKLDITPPFLQSHRGIKFFRFSDIVADQREFQNSDYFRQFFKPFGWYYTACLSYWHGTELSSVIALRRTQQQGDYRSGEIELFKELHAHIEVVLNRLLPAHKEQTKARWLGEFAQYLPLPLLLLDWNLETSYVNREASEQCAVWNFGPDRARTYDPRAVFRTPPAVIRACEELKTRWFGGNRAMTGTEQPRASSRLSHPDLPEFTATITLQTDSKNLIAKPGFLIYFDRRETADRPLDDSRDQGALWRLTAAERELLRLASEGCSNQDIAEQLHKSINTVKHQLTSIYIKLGINGRRKRLMSSLGRGLSPAGPRGAAALS